MGKVFYQKYDVPDGMTADALKLAEKCVKKDDNALRRGTNETTKAIERGVAQLVYIAEDVEPPEIVAHLPLLADERKISYIFVPSKNRLGASIGLDVPSAAACITEPGDAEELIQKIVTSVEELKQRV